jgi:hypothetical protein
MVVVVVAVHVVISGKKVSSIKKKEKGKKKMYQGSSPCCRCQYCRFGVAAAAAVSSYRRGSRLDSTNTERCRSTKSTTRIVHGGRAIERVL